MHTEQSIAVGKVTISLPSQGIQFRLIVTALATLPHVIVDQCLVLLSCCGVMQLS